ncbi:hypothetical protein ABT256_20290 [Amycolatopsis japonica]|uniref:hypothetical protein n=1 Tax=Amycolatopsis japonica TaxID=208439 RepID=UPI00332E76F2
MAEATMTTGTTSGSTPDAEMNVFAVELERWRDVRGFSRTALAKALGYDRSRPKPRTPGAS